METFRIPSRRIRVIGVLAAVAAAAGGLSAIAFATAAGAAPTVTMSHGPYSDQQSVSLSIPANSTFAKGSGIFVLECADPFGSSANLPTSDATCDGNTVQGQTVTVASDGSFSLSAYILYKLPSTALAEPPNAQPVCDSTHWCVLYLGQNQNDFTAPHVFSAPFYFGSTAPPTTSSSTSTTKPPVTSTTKPGSTTTTKPRSTTTTTSPMASAGYWMLSANGTVYPLGSAASYGSATGVSSAGIIATSDGKGYWVASSSGSVYPYGDAPSLSFTSPPSGTAVTVAATHDGKGLWVANSAGQVFTAGDARSFGNAPSALNAPVVDMAPTPDGMGYWMLAGDGGVFTFGNAAFFGSTGSITLNKPAVAMAPTSDGKGYWFVASDGGMFSFGDATYYGSVYQLNPSVAAGGSNSIAPVNQSVNGIVVTSDGMGYWMVAADGGVFTFGDAGFVGSLGGNPPSSPIVGFTPV